MIRYRMHWPTYDMLVDMYTEKKGKHTKKYSIVHAYTYVVIPDTTVMILGR
jgi:hypothetical protein